MAIRLQQSTTAYKIPFLLVLSSDHLSPATGKTPTVTISKNGGAFGSPSGAVSEVSAGWYVIAGNATDSNTLGPLCVHVTEASSDNSDSMFEVVVQDLTTATVALVTTVTTVTNQLTAAAIATGVWQDTTAGDFTTASSIGKGLYPGNHAPGAASGLSLVGSSMDVSSINSVSASAVTTIKAVQGLTTADQVTTAVTATNLTNAPTNGDLTATMKTSVTTAVTGASVNATQFAGQTITAAAGVTLPASVASPTNITAGTITTVTNLTNAATAGDFTATMKTSITTAATAATPTAAAVTAAVTITGDLSSTMKTSVEDAVWDATLASHLGAGSTGNALNAAGSSGDPWATALPGAYGAGSAGLLLGTTIPADLATITADIVALPTPPSAATILATAMPESYSAKGGTKTLAQVLYEIAALVGNFKISGTTMSLIALDGVTVKETLTLDSNTAPTTITRTT